MQAATEQACIASSTPLPPYSLSELIGKGNFGRVYKATDIKSDELVVIKMVNIGEGDSLRPGATDIFSDI